MSQKDYLRKKLPMVVSHLQEDIDDEYNEIDWVKEDWQDGLDYVYNHLKPALERKFREYNVNVYAGWETEEPTDKSWRIILEEKE